MICNRILLALIIVWPAACAFAQDGHEWSSISYPKIPTEFGSGSAVPTVRRSEEGLKLSLAFSWSDADSKRDGFKRPDGNKIKQRLHYADGEKVEHLESDFDRVLMLYGRRGNLSGSFSCTFPWGENEMHEAWLQISIEDRNYWLEIPYGFTRNPTIEKLPSANTGPPQLPPALKPFPTRSQIVNWKHVNYDLGEIQNGWRLYLLHSNPFDAQSEIVLYRADSAVGKSMFLWDLHKPRTKLAIKHANGFNLKSRAMSIRLHDDGMRRSDTFEFNRNPGNDNLRDWGTMVVSVDDKQWKTTMPSSLFRYVHGVSEPHHESTIR